MRPFFCSALRIHTQHKRSHMPVRIGDTARTTCPLYPSGRVLIGNVPYPARSASKSIEAAVDVTVVGGDRFCLIVEVVDSSRPVQSLPRYGEEILIGKELASAESAEAAAEVRRAREEHLREIRRFTVSGLGVGLALGLILVVYQSWRVGFTPDLWLIPPIASVGLASLAAWFIWFGSETNEVLLLIAILAAVSGLIGGTALSGPFVGLAFCFGFGFVVSLASVVLVAIRSPLD
jgi:hypothetical protein